MSHSPVKPAARRLTTDQVISGRYRVAGGFTTIAAFARETGLAAISAAKAIHGESYTHLNALIPPVPRRVVGSAVEGNAGSSAMSEAPAPSVPPGPQGPPWSIETVRAVLAANGDPVTKERPTGNGFGTVLRTHAGVVVSVFRTGTISVQGKHIPETRALFGLPAPAVTAGGPRVDRVADELPVWIIEAPPYDAPEWLSWEPCEDRSTQP